MKFLKPRSHCDDNGKINQYFFAFRCHHNMNTSACCYDAQIFYCHCHHNWAQNPFHDIKIRKIVPLPSPGERALSVMVSDGRLNESD